MAWAFLALVALFAVREAVHYRETRATTLERSQERSQWTEERSELLNRIKPETAQYKVPEDADPDGEPVQTDEEYWEERGYSEEVIARMNGGS